MRIVTENLSYTYGEKSKGLEVKALSGVSLTIEDGEFFGIIGKTGSGKTTFVQHLNGLIRVQKNAGRVIVGEYDLSDKKCDMKSLRAKIGMVFQYPEYQLFAETVKDDVAFGIKNFFPNLGEKETEERVKTALNLVGLDYDRYKDKSPFELSGGQKRRAAIAGVIVTRPEVLVLDEPAAGLDPVGKREFISLLKRLHGEFVKTIVIVSHDMNLVAENCTRAAVFSHGQIIAEGTPKDVFERENAVKEGLELPVTAYLARELNARGYKISVSDLTVNGFADAVANEFFARKKRGREE
jgi:cobalt import ATP-binding protein cbiO 1